jgi:hypothetical protein
VRDAGAARHLPHREAGEPLLLEELVDDRDEALGEGPGGSGAAAARRHGDSVY